MSDKPVYMFDALSVSELPIKEFPFPGTGAPVSMKVLTCERLELAKFETERYFEQEKIPYGPATAESYVFEKTLRLLFYALRTAQGHPLAETLKVFKQNMTHELVETLIEIYQEHERAVSPNPDHMSEEDFEGLVDEVKKNPEEVLSLFSSSIILKRLIIILVNQPLK